MDDLIGDIHGHADALERLLNALGYARQHGIYRHSDRKCERRLKSAARDGRTRLAECAERLGLEIVVRLRR